MKKRKKRYNSPKTKPVNRKYKDRLFRFAFQDKKDLLELYNAVNGTNYQNKEELIITTLEDVLFLGMKNDLSFIIGADLNLYEHQSTWSANMPLRGLLYFASLYQEYVEQNGYDLYGSKKIILPFPNYVVFYNGDQSTPDQVELSLSDAFEKMGKENGWKMMVPSVECRVKVLNINQGHNRELMEKCRRLWEYSEFIEQVKENLRAGLEIRKAINMAIDECKEKGILADLLSRCRTEVFRMLLTEYDEKKTMDYIRKEAQELGEERGRKIGEAIGEERGKKIGEIETTERLNKLNALLISKGLYEDLKKASEDTDYQKELLKAYGI